ncbi:MAG: HD domain-containing protein [Lachnospiraceae bacterium]|nr:HD domain-containing protein [Lachnospiraceae bacterium]
MYDLIRENQLDIMLLLCGICATSAFLLCITRFLSQNRKRILLLMEIIALLLLWFDREAYIYSGDVSNKGYIMVRVANFAVFFLTSAVVLSFNLYLSDWLLNEGKLKQVPKRLVIVQYMAIVGMVLSIISAFTDLYYYFDEMNKYHRGNGFLIAYIIPIIGPLIQLTVICQNRKRFRKLIFISMELYIFVPLVCGILQIFTYGISIVNMAMVMVSVFLYIFTYMDINETAEHTHEIELKNMKIESERMQRLFDETATAFVSAVEKKDELLQGSAQKVADYAKRIAEMSGMDKEKCEDVYYAALLHDVGLIGIPDKVIENDKDPSAEDSEIMRRRPLIGKDILSSITEYPYLSEGAHYSHERYDGSGYPEGLKGEQIPEIARIIGVADAYVTMRTKKRYREARPDFVAREAFVKGSGVEFDPKYADIMVKIIDKDNESAMQEESQKVENEISCRDYRDSITAGIPIENEETRVTFTCAPKEGIKDSEFWSPSLIMFDSYDRRVHDNERAIRDYQYLEYGEFWFDGHSIQTAARKIEEKVTVQETAEGADAAVAGTAENDAPASYEIVMGRYDDHLRLVMNSPAYRKEVIVALPTGSKAAYIAITGENCEIKDITTEQTGEKYTEESIHRIAEVISFIDHMESDIKNIQIDRTRSASTEGIECRDRLKIMFHTMSLPGANLVWHCPYVVLFTSDDGRVDGPNYKEHALIKLYGENECNTDDATNNIVMKRTDEFPGWDAWKEKNREGMECELTLRRKNAKIILKTTVLGIDIENTTTLKNASEKVYVALTGDQVALTDIRVR